MKYRELSEEQYMVRLRLVIAGAEGLHARPENVGDGRATIGWGYTFNRSNNVEIWRRSGIELDAESWKLLADIDRAPKDARTRLGLQLPMRLDEADSDRLLRASLTEFEAPANRLRMPLSDERIALTSVAYNRGPGALTGMRGGPEHPVMTAIRDADRAEAWYQLRYNCWGTRQQDEGGLRKRRFAEAQVFGLYDDPERVTPNEARSVLAMSVRRRNDIDRVEDRFGDSLDAPPATPNRIAQANRDYPALVSVYGRVPTLEQALAPAHAALAPRTVTDRTGLLLPAELGLSPTRIEQAGSERAAELDQTAAGSFARNAENSAPLIATRPPIPDPGIASAGMPTGRGHRREQEGEEMSTTPVLANNPAHPDHATFNRIHAWVRGTGQWNDEQSMNVASAVYREQAQAPLVKRVDQVTGGLGQDGAQNVFATYAPHGDKGPFFHARVDGRQAAEQPAQQSLQQAEEIGQQYAQVQAMQQAQDQPTRAAPSLMR